MPKALNTAAIAIVLLAASSPARTDDVEPRFPEAHKEFLGAASYSAMFGPRPNDVDIMLDSLSPMPGPPPRVGSNVQVNDPQMFPFGRNEPTIATTGNGKFMVLGWNDGEGFCGPPFSNFVDLGCPAPEPPGFTGFGYSSDGARSFIDGGAPKVGDSIGFGPGPSGMSESGVYITLGDPSIDVGGYGNETFYHANLAEFIDQFPVGLGPVPTAGVVVHTGRFGPKKQFQWADPVLLQSPNYPWDFLDKEHIAADKRADSDNVYVSVTNFAEVEGIPFFGFGQIEVYLSPDGGATWGRSVLQPDETISVLGRVDELTQVTL